MNAALLEHNICEDSRHLGCYALWTGRYVVTNILKEHSIFIFSDKQSNSSSIAWTLKMAAACCYWNAHMSTRNDHSERFLKAFDFPRNKHGTS